jgi:TM2 domain-containing membrane protein YozV
MNCANHPDRERSAFCQNCGKPLCTECVRHVGSSIYCEPCLTARVAGAPPAGYAPGAAGYAPVPPISAAEPNPGIAALLGFIPGVGAMYNGQYAKGIVHLMVFALLISLASDVNGIFGLFVAGWIAYMVIEAHHTARARRDGTPLPNPFGLNDLSERLGFGKSWPGAGAVVEPVVPINPVPGGQPPYTPPAAQVPPAGYAPPYGYPYAPPASTWGAPNDPAGYAVPPVAPVQPFPDPDLSYSRRFPAGAIWLIVLGLLFLLGDTHLFHFFHGRFLGPILLIGLGIWVFVRRMTSTGPGLENDGSQFYRWRLMRAITSCFWLVFTGFIWLLDEAHILSWSHSWPLFIIGAGVMLFVRHAAYSSYGYGYVPPTPPVPPAPAHPQTAIVPTASHTPTGSAGQNRTDQEGR